MHGEYRERKAGFTLVEVMVVLAIVALVSAIAVPGLAKLGAFSRDEFKRTTQDLTSALRYAQTYAKTYNVNTSVVYTMDNWSLAEARALDTLPVGNPIGEDSADPNEVIVNPIVDSLTGADVRQIEGYAVMYQYPGTTGELAGKYLPVPGEMGEFRNFPFGMAILLQSPHVEDIDKVTDPLKPRYRPFYEEFFRSNFRSDATINQTWLLGMSRITAALGVQAGLSEAELKQFDPSSESNYYHESFLAHVFKPSARLSTSSTTERFTIHVAPSPGRPLEERLVQPENPGLDYQDSNGIDRSNLLFQEIHLFKSTGRVSAPMSH